MLSTGFGFGLNFGVGSFTPSMLSGLVADFDFTDASTLTLVSATHISAVANRVSGVTAAQTTDSKRPILTTPGGGAASYAQFTAASLQLLTTTEAAVVNAFKDSNACTVISAIRLDSVASSVQIILSADVAGVRPYRLFFCNTNRVSYEAINDSGGTDQFLNSSATLDTSPHVIAWRDSGSLIRAAKDGSEVLNSAYTAQTPKTITRVSLGAWNSGSYLSGRLYRVLVYSRVLTDGELASVNAYLGSIIGV